jgi:hypothetical protein
LHPLESAAFSRRTQTAVIPDLGTRHAQFAGLDSAGTVSSADDKSWGDVGAEYLKPLKRWLWDHALK